MKTVKFNVQSTLEFYKALREAAPYVVSIFRAHNGFICEANGREIELTPVLAFKSAFDSFFFGNSNGFEGELTVPECTDFGLDESAPVQVESAKAEPELNPPPESVKPIEQAAEGSRTSDPSTSDASAASTEPVA